MKKIFTHDKRTFSKKSGSEGFTLVELMVALTLFTIVVLATISSLLIVNDAAKKVQSMRAVMDNLNFAVESMTRTLRTGSDFDCGDSGGGTDCSFDDGIPGEAIEITSAESTSGSEIRVRYWLDETNGVGAIKKTVYVNNSVDIEQNVTAPEIDVETLNFYVQGTELDDGIQPSVTIFITGNATSKRNQVAPFSIQSYVSQRTLE